MSEMFLVRHGQASYGGDEYDRLSTLGHQQARWLGEYFKYRNLQFDQIICGGMVRHRETLEGISAGMGEPLESRVVHEQWNEFDFESMIKAFLQQFPGQIPAADAPRSEFAGVLRNTLETWAANKLEHQVPETFDQFEQRVSTALSMAIAAGREDRGSRVLVVSSGGAISMALRQVLKTPPQTVVRMNLQTRNSSYSHLFFNEKGIHLSGFNHIPHLDHPDREQAVTYY